MDVSLERFGVEQASHEKHLLAEIVERRQDFTQLHLLAFALGPPLFAVKAVAGKQHGQPHGGFA